MKKSFYIHFIIGLLLLGITNSCHTNPDNLPHKGENKTQSQSLKMEWNSTVIDVLYTGYSVGQGDIFMRDSIITLASYPNRKIYNYDCRNFELIGSHLGHGQGPNELSAISYATPVMNDTTFFIYDGNGNALLYNNQYQLTNKGLINFGWADQGIGKYDSPSVYNFISRTDFGIGVYKYGENLIIPLQPMIHYDYIGEEVEISKEHFSKSHIFGLLDMNTMKVNKVFGHYSPVYQKQLMPQFDFFSYTFDNDIFYVDYPVDSLIYVYEYPDKPLYCFGFECKDIERKYATSNTQDDIYENLRHCGFSAVGMKNFPELGLLFRIYMRDMEKGTSGMQIYDSTTYDLLADVDVPLYFQLLGYYDSCLYGVAMIPEETDDNTYLTFYKIKLKR